MRHYFLATKTDTFSNKGSDLVVQYSVKFTKTPECGGSYIKLLVDTDPEKFDNDTPYKCVPVHNPPSHVYRPMCLGRFPC